MDVCPHVLLIQVLTGSWIVEFLDVSRTGSVLVFRCMKEGRFTVGSVRMTLKSITGRG